MSGSRLFLCELINKTLLGSNEDAGTYVNANGKCELSHVFSAVLNPRSELTVDDYGRLILCDSSGESAFRHHDLECDQDGFAETLQICHQDAASVLSGKKLELASPFNSWDLLPSSRVANSERVKVVSGGIADDEDTGASRKTAQNTPQGLVSIGADKNVVKFP